SQGGRKAPKSQEHKDLSDRAIDRANQGTNRGDRAMPNVEQERLIARYAEGPDRLEAALNLVPAEALKWRPGPGKWSVHQVVVHCADSETNSHMRVRYLLGEASPTIIGYDQDRWVDEMDYDAHPLAPALATIR